MASEILYKTIKIMRLNPHYADFTVLLLFMVMYQKNENKHP